MPLLARAIQAAVLAVGLYDLLLPLWGIPSAARAPRGRRSQPFRVLIPAHDEAAVIAGVLQDLAAQQYPAELVEVWVLADRCTDDTAGVAAAWAQVAERSGGADGKAALLRWHLAAHPLGAGGALVVLDADNRVPADLLGRFADELELGHTVLQAYLDVANPDQSWMTTASAVSYWAANRMVQLSRRNLGWSCDLGGTGMCLTAQALTDAGGFRSSLSEDQELAAELELAGHRIVWLHDLRVRDVKPTTVTVALRQRVRWAQGRRQVARRYGVRLLVHAIAARSLSALDLALRRWLPGRAVHTMITALLAAVVCWRPATSRLRPVAWWSLAVAQVLAPWAFLALEGVPRRFLLRYPAAAVYGILWAPIRILARSTPQRWYHTPHGHAVVQDVPVEGDPR